MSEFDVEDCNMTLALQYPKSFNAIQELASVPVALEWWEGLSRKEEAREGIMHGRGAGPVINCDVSDVEGPRLA